ncbi:MAG: energy transducer TonB family protein [Xanthobacteraceae bacterium]
MMIPFVENRSELLRWTACGAFVAFMHGAVAATMLHWNESDDLSQPTAALVIDLSPFPVSPPESMTELPPGPEQVEAEASQQVPVEEVKEQVEETTETEHTQEVQPEVEQGVNPEVALETKPPEPEKSEKPQELQLPAPETTAPQATSFEMAAVAAAPMQGASTPESSNAIPTWRNEVIARLERNKRFPAGAGNDRGIAQVDFSIDRQGRVIASRIIKTSGSSALDRAALDMITRAQPFPPPPAALRGAEIRLTVPVRFNMR